MFSVCAEHFSFPRSTKEIKGNQNKAIAVFIDRQKPLKISVINVYQLFGIKIERLNLGYQTIVIE